MGHQAEAVSPLLIVFLVLEKVPGEDDPFIQGHLWEASRNQGPGQEGTGEVPTRGEHNHQCLQYKDSKARLYSTHCTDEGLRFGAVSGSLEVQIEPSLGIHSGPGPAYGFPLCPGSGEPSGEKLGSRLLPLSTATSRQSIPPAEGTSIGQNLEGPNAWASLCPALGLSFPTMQ